MTMEGVEPAEEVLFEPLKTHWTFQRQMTAMYKWGKHDNKIAILKVKEGDIIGHL